MPVTGGPIERAAHPHGIIPKNGVQEGVLMMGDGRLLLCLFFGKMSSCCDSHQSPSRITDPSALCTLGVAAPATWWRAGWVGGLPVPSFTMGPKRLDRHKTQICGRARGRVYITCLQRSSDIPSLPGLTQCFMASSSHLQFRVYGSYPLTADHWGFVPEVDGIMVQVSLVYI